MASLDQIARSGPNEYRARLRVGEERATDYTFWIDTRNGLDVVTWDAPFGCLLAAGSRVEPILEAVLAFGRAQRSIEGLPASDFCAGE